MYKKYTRDQNDPGYTIQQDFHRSNQFLQIWRIAQAYDVGNYAGTEPVHETETLVADATRLDLLTLRFPRLHFTDRHAQHVRVESTAQTFVGCHHDDADPFYGIALNQEWMTVFGVSTAHVRGDVTNLLAIGTRFLHAFLALRILEAATISMARVIFCVFFTLLILLRISLLPAIG